jgi:hypothetical protein
VGELAARRVPHLGPDKPETILTLRTVAERWKASRVDVAVEPWMTGIRTAS